MCFYIGIEDLAANALIEGKDVEDLISHFRGYVALDVLLAFCNERSVKALGI